MFLGSLDAVTPSGWTAVLFRRDPATSLTVRGAAWERPVCNPKRLFPGRAARSAPPSPGDPAAMDHLDGLRGAFMPAPADSHPSSASPPSRSNAGCLGAVGGVCVAFAVVVHRHAELRASVLEAGLILALLCVAAAARNPGLRGVLPLGAFPLAYLLVKGTQSALKRPVIDYIESGRGDWIVLLLLGVIVLSALPGAVGALLFMALGRPMARVPWRALHPVSLAVLALTTALVAVSTRRALHKTDPERYVASLPSIGVIPPVAGEPSMIEEGSPIPPGPPFETRIYDMTVGPLGIRRLCPGIVGRCLLEVKHAGQPFDVGLVQWLSRESSYPIFDRDPCGPSLHRSCMWTDLGATVVLREASFVDPDGSFRNPGPELRELFVFDGAMYNSPHDDDAGTAALEQPSLEETAASMRALADEISAPRRWIAVAAGGVLLAAALLGYRRRVRRALARIASARIAVLEQNGWLAFEDGSPPVRAGDRGLPVGPVLVLGPSSEGAYRGGAVVEGEIIAGAQDEHLARGRARIAQVDVIVFFVAVLTPLPLLTAAATLNLW
ncbi:hypothetical protein [Sorangium sp. So ce131]|uniref:hypothetical protein n=1 Tax=Sorangium sp. So ce131 TaxID=3133282 RepID=UPI003F63BB3C